MDTVDEPRWLDDEEYQAWVAFSIALIRLPVALDAQLQRDAGLSRFEYETMAGLSMADERTMRLSELATIVEGSLPRLSQVVTRLEKHGWVRRDTDPTDGRYTVATLTDEGYDKVVAADTRTCEGRTYLRLRCPHPCPGPPSDRDRPPHRRRHRPGPRPHHRRAGSDAPQEVTTVRPGCCLAS